MRKTRKIEVIAVKEVKYKKTETVPYELCDLCGLNEVDDCSCMECGLSEDLLGDFFVCSPCYLNTVKPFLESQKKKSSNANVDN